MLYDFIYDIVIPGLYTCEPDFDPNIDPPDLECPAFSIKNLDQVVEHDNAQLPPDLRPTDCCGGKYFTIIDAIIAVED